MKLLFLHGRPAVGKLTVARAVAARTGGRLFHNHLTVDLALSVFDFGTPGFVALRERIWTDVFRAAVAGPIPLLIFTFNPEETVPQRFIDALWSELTAAGVEILPVELVAPEEEIERRISAESRRRGGKLVDAALYRSLRDSGAFDRPVLPPSRIRIDTAALGPEEAAERIAAIL